jgi:hypothetical protein
MKRLQLSTVQEPALASRLALSFISHRSGRSTHRRIQQCLTAVERESWPVVACGSVVVVMEMEFLPTEMEVSPEIGMATCASSPLLTYSYNNIPNAIPRSGTKP